MELTNFLGGLWIPRYFGGVIPSNGLLQATDIAYLPSGGVRGRGGRVSYGSTANAIIGLWRHYPRTGTPAFLEAEDTGASVTIKHDTIGAGTFSSITGGTGFTTGARPYFTNWPQKNKTFFANGFGVWAYNGVIAAVTMTGTQITGPYLVTHQDRLVGSVLNEINYSIYFTDTNDETTVTAGNQLSFNDQQGGSLTGLFSLSDDLIVVMKNTTLWHVLGDLLFSPIKKKYSEIGSIAPAAVAQAPYGIFFVGRKGIYLTDGQNPEPLYLSAPLEPLFIDKDGTTINTYPTAVGGYYPRQDMYIVKLSPAHAYAYFVQRLQVPGQRSAAWAWGYLSSFPMTAVAIWDSEGDSGNLYTGDGSGNVWKMDVGVADNGSAFTPTLQTAFLPFHEHRVGNIYRLRTDYYGGAPCSVGLRYDNAASSAVTVSVGATQTAALQQVRQRTNDYANSGHVVSAVVALPQSGPQTELYRLGMEERLRSARVWR